MDTIVKLTNGPAEQGVDMIVLEVSEHPKEETHEWGMKEAKALVAKLGYSGTVTIWFDPTPIQIGMALLIFQWMSTFNQTPVLIVAQNGVGWPLTDFVTEGKDYAGLVKSEVNI